MGIGLTFRGLANAIYTISGFCIFECIAVDRSSCLSIGTSRSRVYFTRAFVSEMISGCTRSNFARSVLANTRRSMVRRVTVLAMRAAMIILIVTGIFKDAFVSLAEANDTLRILTIFIVIAFRATFAAVRSVAFELFFGQAHRFCI